MTDKQDPNQNKAQETAAPQNNSTPQDKADAKAPTAKQPADKPADAKKAPEQTKKPAPQAKPTSDEQVTGGKKRGTAALILALLLAGGMGGLGYYQHQENQKFNQALASQISSIKSDFEAKAASSEEAFASKLKEAQDAARKAQVQVEQQQKSIQSLQVAISELKGRRPNDWLLAEADYLLKMGARKLFLEHDVVSATELLESADQRIASLNDPSLVSLRQAMTEDISTLRALPLVDQEGLVIKLIDLQKQVDDLPISNAIIPEELLTKGPEEVSSDINDWQENLTNSLKSFSEHFVQFRVRKGNVTPLLSPNQHFYLLENMKSKLETAIQGVNKESNPMYQESLTAALEWSQRFFDQNSLKVQEFQKQLTELSKENIQVDYPTKLVSQQPLTDIISERLRRSMTTLGEEE